MYLKSARFLAIIAIFYAVSSFAQEKAAEVNKDAAPEEVTIQDSSEEATATKIEKAEEKADEAVKEEPKAEEKKEEPAKEESKENAPKEEPKVEEKKEESKVEESAKEESKEEEKPATAQKLSVASYVNADGEIAVEDVVLSKFLLAEIYSPRDYKTIWFDGKTPNANFDKALKFIKLADENGLSLKYFDTGIIDRRLNEKEQGEEFIAKTDILITHMVVEMIQQIGNGNKITDSMKIQTYFERPVRVTKPAAAFEEFMKADDVEEVINKYSPKHPQYALLKKGLKKAIENYKNKRHLKPIKYTRDLVQGDKDIIVSDLRRRLGAKFSVSPDAKNDLFDKILADKVNEYRGKFSMKENGVVDKEFIDNINNFDIESISRIKTNMERYRWLPDDMPKTRVEVNLPDFKLTAYKDGEVDFTMGTISGRLEHKTPLMSTRIYQFVLNPYWNVPKGYAIRNMVPLLRQDPDYVKNQNFDLMKLEKDGWKNVDQSSVNWDSINEGNYGYLLRQRPGNINVLGPIKFAIINPYDIFMHSTSEPWLFTNKFRGYSSGCIRVEDPIKFAKFVREIGGAEISDERFDELYNYYNSKDGVPMKQKPEMNDKIVKLKNPIPMFSTYFSASATEDGTVHFSDDIYNLDFDQSKALGM